jgi:predicted metal-dependent hydrolase
MFKDKDRILNDLQLGEVVFRKNDRAKRYILRIKLDAVSVTIPHNGSYKDAERFFKENRTLLLQKMEELNRKNVSKNNDETERIVLSESDVKNLRQRAGKFLPMELERLSKEYGFHYNVIKIRKSKTRWGSCSSNGTISLSLFLMLLPRHLIEYVILHELCHTIEMNHSPAFWALLDKYTGGQAKIFRKEIKQYRIPIIERG